MRYGLFFLAVIILAFLELTLLDLARVFNIKPNLLLIGVVFAALAFELKWAILFAMLSGALKDIFSINPFGLNTVLFTLLGFFIFKLSRKIFLEDNLSRMIVAFAVVLFYDLAAALVFLFFGNFVSLGMFLRIGFLDSVYSALCFPLLYKAVKPWISL